MLGARTIAGHSLPLNWLFTTLNLAGLVLTAMAFHPAFATQQLLFAIIGITVMVLSTGGLILFKGRLLIATVARVLVGSLFIVSGLIKANDPIGFSYKLKEYFQDGALAFRIKEWFNAPGFSLESVAGSALGISVAICIAEIVLGVLIVIGGKARLTSWLLLLLMLFFTFLTWHTTNCNGKQKYTDRDTYSLSDTKTAMEANRKLEASKTNKDIRIISKTANEIVVDEIRTVDCVGDCGCFGDAMKGAVGRSLTPSESLWKDLILLYLVCWIFAAQGIILPNNVRQNWAIIPIVLVLTAFFCWVFDWYFPLLFTAIALVTALWIYRSGGKILGNHYGSALLTVLWSGALIWYCLHYTPLRDYRPYAVGQNLEANMKNGGVKDEKLVLASIDSLTFNPFLPISAITQYELKLQPVADQMKNATAPGLRLKDIANGRQFEIMQIQYNVESYPIASYQVTDTIVVTNEEFTGVSIRDFILDAPELIMVVSMSLAEMDKDVVPQLKGMCYAAQKAGVPFILVTSASEEAVAAFRKKYAFNGPIFINDERELKVISRSNPAVIVLKKGTVAGKYPHNSIPTFAWIQTHLFKK